MITEEEKADGIIEDRKMQIDKELKMHYIKSLVAEKDERNIIYRVTKLLELNVKEGPKRFIFDDCKNL